MILRARGWSPRRLISNPSTSVCPAAGLFHYIKLLDTSIKLPTYMRGSLSTSTTILLKYDENLDGFAIAFWPSVGGNNSPSILNVHEGVVSGLFGAEIRIFNILVSSVEGPWLDAVFDRYTRNVLGVNLVGFPS